MKIEYIDADLFKNAFIMAANTLENNKDMVNALNVFPVPDGDTGTNMSLTMKSAVKQIKKITTNDVQSIASAVANGSLMGARGNSGVILSQIFRGFSKGLKDKTEINSEIFAEALISASDTAYKAVMKPIEGTVLTVVRECAEKAKSISNKKDIIEFLEEVVSHGEIILKKTPEMLDVLKEAGVVDAGGKGFIFIMKGFLYGLKGDFEDLEDIDNEQFDISEEKTHENIKYIYCTGFIINSSINVESFREAISKFGDSLVVAGADDMAKVHIHTNNPGQVIEYALEFGELTDINIDNMKYQHNNNEMQINEETENNNKEKRKYSFIAVAMGDGIEKVFKDLNTDKVILGGQTMNPSTEDILKSIDEVEGENIIILPNNSNIIMAATQAKELSNRTVEVLPTKSIPQGIAALLANDEELSLEQNLENMKEAYMDIKTGQITFAVRDTVINDKEIKKDNIIGLCDGEIKAVGDNINDVGLNLLKAITDDESDLITIFYGEEIKEEQANQLAEKVEEELDDYDVEVVYGGQPLYYYLFSVE